MAIGILISLAIVLPNVIWLAYPPVEAKPPVATLLRQSLVVLTWVETIARMSVVAIPLFSRSRSAGLSLGVGGAIMALAWTLYVICWARYYARGREVRWLYASWWRVPVPMAVAPTLYFAAAGLVLASPWLAMAAVALGVSHIPLSLVRREQA